jgi:hypothetical protein
MIKSIISKDYLHTFLANSQKITTRAVRLAEEQNPEKYEREAMGALMKAAGYSLDDLINHLTNYPKVFDFEENIKKLKVMESLSHVLGSKYARVDITDFADYRALSGFISKYFENYSNEYNGRLNFYAKDQIENGMLESSVLVCESIDLLSCYDKPISTKHIPLSIPDMKLSFSLDSLINDIKESFPDYSDKKTNQKVHNIKQVLRTVNDRKYDDSTIMGFMQDKLVLKNEVYLDYIELSFEDKIKMKPTYFYNNTEEIDGYFNINGLEYIRNNEHSYIETNDAIFEYLTKVAQSMNILDNIVISTNIVNIMNLKEKFKTLEEEDISDYLGEYSGYIDNMQYIIFESISEGLAKSLKNAEKHIEIIRPLWKTIKQSSLNKKWETIGENLYTREIQI